jgi:hypothetical protein
MTNTEQAIADARAQLATAQAGNLMDRLMALEAVAACLLDLLARGKKL